MAQKQTHVHRGTRRRRCNLHIQRSECFPNCEERLAALVLCGSPLSLPGPHGLDHSVWQRLAVVGCQLWLVNLLVPWGRWPDDEMLSPWSAARVPVFLTCFVVRIRTLRTSSRVPERLFGLVVHVSKTLSLAGKWQGCSGETAFVSITYM